MADLTVTLTESVTLEGEAKGSTNTLTIAGINQTLERIVSCPDSQTTTLVVFNSDVHGAAGAVDTEDTRYVRITNLESADLKLAIVGTSDNYQVNLKGGHSHVLSTTAAFLLGETGTTPTFGTLEDVASIQVRNTSGAAKKVELFIAGV